MINPGEVTCIRWNGAKFDLYRDPLMVWHCHCTRDGAQLYQASGPDVPFMLTKAIAAAGFDESTKWEILDALMSALRERMFN